MAFLLTFEIVTALFLATISLYRYGNIPQQHILVTLSVLTAWCFSFLIVFSIPLDVTSTLYRQCVEEHRSIAASGNESTFTSSECQAPWGMVPAHIFPHLWRIIYWSSQLLTWLIMPLMRSYLKAGDFTVKGKLKSALRQNGITYGALLSICLVLRIYIAVRGEKLNWEKQKAIAASASNTWGLFLHILLLGYALVEVPRSLWNNCRPGFTLQYAYFRAAKLYGEKSDAEELVDEILESVQSINQAMPHSHELRPCLEAILLKVPVELLVKSSGSFARSNTSFTIEPTEKTLIRIHAQVIKALQTLQRAEALWSLQVQMVLHLEDVARNMQSLERRFKSEFPRQRTELERMWYSPTMEWYWECRLKMPFLRIMSILTATMSVMVVWSELTFFCRRPVLSIFANAIYVAKDSNNFFTIEVLSTTVLCYFLYCTYSTILRIRFLNLYYLAPHHQTNELSLIFSGMLLCRLTPPMCLNFLGLIHMDTHIIPERIKETAYTHIMGHMDVIGIIANGFNIYFPMCMLIICLATWFRVGSRVLNSLSALGFEQFLENERIATELVQEGMDLMAREKRRLQRAEQAMARRRKFNRQEMVYIGEYRKSGGGDAAGGDAGPGVRTSADGLLCDNERSLDYSSVSSSTTVVMPRFLSTEISNHQFGESAPVQVDNGPIQEVECRLRSSPPRGIFDDV
ncbi:LMBR1 domain-containing protein 2 homolog [Drosophila serrata]|uniref:LMBR1 domain-containing protein 2 homolog n=1 Tax=Drosophila serrata TaxID=7274 RepID=UPI000A1CF8E9|nr:LMBR1 domain-containing protein 2 homolog [Drosophila serrata]